MKRIVIMICTLLIIMSISVFATSDVKVLLNDEYLNFVDEKGNIVNPEITNSRTMVPLRKIFSQLGAKIEWDDATKTVTAIKGETAVKLTINSNIAYITNNNITEEIILDAAPYIVDGRTLIPLRFVSESFNCLVGWDNNTRTAIIINPETLIKYTKEQLMTKCSNIIDFVKMIDTSNYYSMTDIKINMKDMNNIVFQDEINFKIINNQDKIYLKFINNPFKENDEELSQEEINNTFFEMDIGKVSEEISNNSIEEVFEDSTDLEIKLTTYKEMKDSIDLFVQILSKGKITENKITLTVNVMDIAKYIDEPNLKAGEIYFSIELDENRRIKEIDLKIEAEYDKDRASIEFLTETTYLEEEYKLSTTAIINPMEDLITTFLMIIIFYGI